MLERLPQKFLMERLGEQLFFPDKGVIVFLFLGKVSTIIPPLPYRIILRSRENQILFYRWKQEGTRRVLRLALLAPPIVDAIFAGKAPWTLSLTKLNTTLPYSWKEQMESVWCKNKLR